MKKRRRRLFGRKPAHPTDNPTYCDELSAFWSLKILLELNGMKGLLGYPKNLTSDGVIMNTIGLGKLEDKQMKLKQFKQTLSEQLNGYIPEIPDVEGVLCENIYDLAELVGLSDVEQQLLAFAVILHSHTGFDETADTLGDLTLEGVKKTLSHLLQLDFKMVSHALSSKGTLARTGLLTIDRSCSQVLKSKLELPAGFVDVVLESHADVLSLLSQFFTEAGKASLKPENFEYLDKEYTILRDLLLAARRKSIKGVNILLYGPPGTGKTELARVLTKSIGARGFEISFQGEGGNSDGKFDRFNSFQLSQHALEKQKDAVLIFDEIEDVFTSSIIPFFGKVQSSNPRKAWTNRLLEENPVPAIWISNEIDQIDPAFLRRFSFALKLDIPPRRVRERILKQHFQTAGIGTDWIHRISSDSRITPAMAAVASKVVEAIGNDGGASNEAILEHVLGNSLSALGHAEPLKQESKGSLTYRVEALNPDYDIAQILTGLKHCQQMRVCLYGPPGTGKTELGRHIANTLDKPLLVKRASDLLGPYVGMTEHNISKMFERPVVKMLYYSLTKQIASCAIVGVQGKAGKSLRSMNC